MVWHNIDDIRPQIILKCVLEKPITTFSYYHDLLSLHSWIQHQQHLLPFILYCNRKGKVNSCKYKIHNLYMHMIIHFINATSRISIMYIEAINCVIFDDKHAHYIHRYIYIYIYIYINQTKFMPIGTNFYYSNIIGQLYNLNRNIRI